MRFYFIINVQLHAKNPKSMASYIAFSVDFFKILYYLSIRCAKTHIHNTIVFRCQSFYNTDSPLLLYKYIYLTETNLNGVWLNKEYFLNKSSPGG